MKKKTLIRYLNTYLQVKKYDDPWFINDLEIDSNKEEIKRIGFAVDCTTYIIDKAVKAKVDLLIVHHGLHIEPKLISSEHERIEKLHQHNLALYVSHMPLDGHPEISNNVLLGKGFIKFFHLKSYKIVPFGILDGIPYGFAVRFSPKIDVQRLKDFCKQMGLVYEFHNYGKKTYIQSLALFTGSANEAIGQLVGKDYDLYLTGEIKHSSFCKCKEMKQSVLLGGHYETEVFGLQALATHLEKKFKIDTVFLDEKY